jgi:hypothetical protein
MVSKVKWMVSTHAMFNLIESMGSDNVIAIEPEKLLQNLAKNDPGMLHYTCPAFVDSFKNTFIYKAPFDITIKIDPIKRTVELDKNSDIVEKYLHDRKTDCLESGKMVFSLNYFLLFITDDDIEIETIPCLYHQNSFIENTMVVSGRFNIRDWIRSVELAAIVKNSEPTNKECIYITIKRGDPLMYIRFHPKDGSLVKLEQEFDLDVIEKYTRITRVTSLVKQTNPHTKLFDLYKMFLPFRKKLSSGKCPFRFK